MICSLSSQKALAGAVVVSLALLAGSSAANSAEIMPDFSLIDVNSTSATYNRPVSPRDYLKQVSAWYFGYAT